MSDTHRILFVSSTIAGGSGRSQRALALALRERGHEVAFLVDDERPATFTRWIGEHLADAATRFADNTCLQRIAARVGSRLDRFEHEGIEMWATPFPENGFAEAVRRFEPDVIIGNSMVRYSWRTIRGACHDLDLPAMLYIRGSASLGGLDTLPDPGEVVLANARSLVESVEDAGHECTFIPSVVDTSPTRVDSTRQVALLINPIESHGIDRLWEIAEALPEIEFVLQESWELDNSQLSAIVCRLEELSNVNLRRRTPPGPELYRDARVLLAPHRIDNRPRVIVEAQTNGIPSLVSDHGGLREALGSGGAVLADDASEWIDAVRCAFEDDARYLEWSAGASKAAVRDELDPTTIVQTFEKAARTAIDRRTSIEHTRETAPRSLASADGSS